MNMRKKLPVLVAPLEVDRELKQRMCDYLSLLRDARHRDQVAPLRDLAAAAAHIGQRTARRASRRTQKIFVLSKVSRRLTKTTAESRELGCNTCKLTAGEHTSVQQLTEVIRSP